MRSNTRPALRLSTLRPHQIEMTPDRPFAVVCPDCRVWRRINRGRIQPHFLSDETTYCQASAQRVEKDVTPEKWALALAEGVADTASRRPTTVLRKVKSPQPVALHQLTPAVPTAESAGAKYESHRNGCSACTDKEHCLDGGGLAATYLRLLRQEPERRAAQARAEEEQRLVERKQVAALFKRRAAEWPDAQIDFLLAKRRRAMHIVGDLVEPIKGAAVPVGAVPIGTVRSAEDVLAENPVRKNQRSA
ncbi:hypothetical protein ACWC5I_28660 [Kitasatospora sp. NPDC001574]